VDIGGYTNIEDRAVVTTSKPVGGEGAVMTKIGSHVTVASGATLTSCTVEGHNHIGAGAVIGQGALVEEFAIVSEGTVVHPGRRIPGGQMWAGNPAEFVRNVTKEEMAALETGAEATSALAEEHAAEFLPESAVHVDAEAQAGQRH
jgi:carbonic anhydrase/acetyltransferase-like protein (isoleucine patch superfamily)